AVFDRLSTDVVFRSVATRLVQRYGHLRPTVDPDSEMGKQQELLTKERVRRLVQIESQEDAESTKPPKTETSETRTGACDPYDASGDRACAPGSSARPDRINSNPDRNYPQRESTPNYPNEGQPTSPSSRILQAESNSDSDDLQLGRPADGSTLFQSVSNPLKQPSDLTSYGSSDTGSMGGSPMGRMSAGSTQSLANEISAGETP